MYRLDMVFSFIFSVGDDIIQVHNDKDIKLFRKNLIDIVLECSQSISLSKRHHLILKITVFGPDSRYLFIFFANSHSVISNSEVKLSKPPSLPQLI